MFGWFGYCSMLLSLVFVQVAPTLKIPTVSDPDRGLELWSGARVGMTLPQLRAQFPAGVTPERATELTDGEAERLQLQGVTFANRPVEAQFYFRENVLVAVKLAFADLHADRPGLGLVDAKATADILKRQYGVGYDCGDRSFQGISALECKWLRNSVSIRYWYMDTAGQAPLMYIAFRQSDDPGYDL